MPKSTCSVDHCENQAAARGWCRKHYKRWYYNGAPDVVRTSSPPRPPSKGTVCNEPGCDSPAWASRLCCSHYQRRRNARRKSLPPDTRVCTECEVAKSTADFPTVQARICVDCRRAKYEIRRAAPPRKRVAPRDQRKCTQCGAEFVRTQRQRHCSPECSAQAKFNDDVKNVGVRRARKAQVESEVFLKVEIFDRDGWICQLCGGPIDRALPWPDPRSVSLDHITPISLGGAHTRANTQAAHLFCNLSKHNRVA